ncbi:MAG: haloalkane dehalogenase [Kordiimonas sp.]
MILKKLTAIGMGLLLMVATSFGLTANPEYARHDFPYISHYVEVMGSKMHYVDTGGKGDPIVMLHGQPTWSYLWRDIIPHLEEKRRVIALDLIGFGKSDKPDIGYTAPEHAKYLAGFMDALALDDITLVIHDWGSVLGFDYAASNPDRVKAIAFMEAAVMSDPVEEPYGRPKAKLSGAKPSPFGSFAEILKQIKTPGVGEKMILEENFFLEQLVLPSFDDLLTEDQKNAYREPFAEGKSRRPMLQFPRDVPIDGENPAYTVEMMAKYNRYLRTQENLPKLLLHISEGFLIDRWDVEWMRRNFTDLTIHNMGPGGHFMQEFNPDGIGKAIALWMDENDL